MCVCVNTRMHCVLNVCICIDIVKIIVGNTLANASFAVAPLLLLAIIRLEYLKVAFIGRI